MLTVLIGWRATATKLNISCSPPVSVAFPGPPTSRSRGAASCEERLKMPLARLEDLKTILARARAAGYNYADEPTWPTSRIIAAMQTEAEKFGFDPEDGALEHEISMAVDQGRSTAVEMARHRGEPIG